MIRMGLTVYAYECSIKFTKRKGLVNRLVPIRLTPATQSPGFNRLSSLCVIFLGSFAMLPR